MSMWVKKHEAIFDVASEGPNCGYNCTHVIFYAHNRGICPSKRGRVAGRITTNNLN